MTDTDKKLKKEIGLRIRKLREGHKMTRDALMDILSTEYSFYIDEKTLQRYENGTYIPNTDILIIFSKIYGVSLDFLIFGRETSDDNAYTWEASLKRLNRLIFSCVLIPSKEENKGSPYYGKYYFAAFDEEIKVYMDRLLSYTENVNYDFEVRSEKPDFTITDLDNLIGNFRTYKDDLSPSLERMNSILYSASNNPDDFLNEHIKSIMRKRKQ